MLAGLLVVAVAFAGAASFVDPESNAGRTPADDGGPRALLPAGPAARRGFGCAGCGVVESVSRVDARESSRGGCFMANFEHYWNAAIPEKDDALSSLSALVDLPEDAFTGRLVAKRAMIAPSYRIVVRLHDGSRRVFREASARELRSGERVQVIAGLELPAR